MTDRILSFTKMHGIGNDYIYRLFQRKFYYRRREKFAPILSERHFSIGGDGIILIMPPHAVIFVNDLKNIDIETVGKLIENNSIRFYLHN